MNYVFIIFRTFIQHRGTQNLYAGGEKGVHYKIYNFAVGRKKKRWYFFVPRDSSNIIEIKN